jgi:hypothetical protein
MHQSSVSTWHRELQQCCHVHARAIKHRPAAPSRQPVRSRTPAPDRTGPSHRRCSVWPCLHSSTGKVTTPPHRVLPRCAGRHLTPAVSSCRSRPSAARLHREASRSKISEVLGAQSRPSLPMTESSSPLLQHALGEASLPCRCGAATAILSCRATTPHLLCPLSSQVVGATILQPESAPSPTFSSGECHHCGFDSSEAGLCRLLS